MRDYWLNRFFFEMQKPDVRQRFADSPQQLMSEYRLSAQAQEAVASQDMAYLAARTNPYLLRYYFGYIGMRDPEFIARLRALTPSAAPSSHG
jgi:hypothetical protein